MIRNSRLTDNQVSARDEQQIQECEKDMLKLYAYRAEVVRFFYSLKILQQIHYTLIVTKQQG